MTMCYFESWRFPFFFIYVYFSVGSQTIVLANRIIVQGQVCRGSCSVQCARSQRIRRRQCLSGSGRESVHLLRALQKSTTSDHRSCSLLICLRKSAVRQIWYRKTSQQLSMPMVCVSIASIWRVLLGDTGWHRQSPVGGGGRGSSCCASILESSGSSPRLNC